MSIRNSGIQSALKDCANIALMSASNTDKLAKFPSEAIESLKSAKLLACAVEKERGGLGLNLSEISEICMTLGQCCASTAMIFAMHQTQLLCLVRHHENSRYLSDFLSDCVNHQLLIASATSEKGVGGNIRSSIAAIEVKNNRVHLRKSCSTISYGEFADALLVTSRRSLDAPESDQVLTLFRRPEYDIEKISEWDALGMRGTCSSGFHFSGSTSRESIFPTDFRLISNSTMTPYAHILWASVWLGISTSAFNTARSLYATNCSSQQTLHFSEKRLASAQSKLDALSLILKASIASQELASPSKIGAHHMLSTNNLKTMSSQLAVEICTEAMIYCGFAGYSNVSTYSVSRNLRDSLSAPIMVSNDRIAEINANLLLMSI